MEMREALVTWLKNAYAMENSMIEVLEKHAKDASGYPDVREKVEEHLEATRGHAETVQGCLDSLGEEASGIKAFGAEIMGKMQGMTMGEDKVVKNAIMDYAAEHFEIAAYHAIIQVAEELGEDGIAEACEGILEEEMEMAGWLDDNLSETVELTVSE